MFIGYEDAVAYSTTYTGYFARTDGGRVTFGDSFKELEAFVRAYKRINPTATVEVSYMGWGNSWLQDLAERINSGQ